MGRKNKKGLNYFTLDVSFSDSIKLATIEAGNNVIPVLIELWQKIYGSHGYYMDFQEDNKLLFISSALTKITLDELEKLMQVFFKRGIFSKQIYEKYQILTSDSIQERYVESCIISKRQNTIIYSEYLCYEIMPEEAEKFVIRSINDEKIQFIQENSGINEENSGIIQENSGKSTYKIDRKNSIDILNTNSGKNQEKNNIVLPTTYSQVSDELKNNSKTKMFCIQTYKIKETDYNRFIDWFVGLNSDHSDNEIVDFKEWNNHFKQWMKFNYDKLPKDNTQRNNTVSDETKSKLSQLYNSQNALMFFERYMREYNKDEVQALKDFQQAKSQSIPFLTIQSKISNKELIYKS